VRAGASPLYVWRLRALSQRGLASHPRRSLLACGVAGGGLTHGAVSYTFCLRPQFSSGLGARLDKLGPVGVTTLGGAFHCACVSEESGASSRPILSRAQSRFETFVEMASQRPNSSEGARWLSIAHACLELELQKPVRVCRPARPALTSPTNGGTSEAPAPRRPAGQDRRPYGTAPLRSNEPNRTAASIYRKLGA
jgi:hypothetical protein